MTTTTQLLETERKRSKTIAAVSFVLAPIILLTGFLAGGEAGYDSLLFVWSHVGALLSVILVAIGVTALLYGEGVRGLGLAGLIGAGFAYVGVGATALWVPIAWEATVLAQAGSSSLGTFASLFSPLGSGYMVTVVFLFALTVAGISLGLYGSGLVHRAVAALGTALGVVTAFVMLYILSMAVPNPTEYVLLGVVMWLSLLPIGASLYMNRGASMADVETEEATTSA